MISHGKKKRDAEVIEILEALADASYNALKAIKEHLETGDDSLLLDAAKNLSNSLAILEK